MNFEERVLEKCKDYNNIFIFISKEDEIDTHEIIKSLLLQKKRVIVPICNTLSNEIVLSELKEFDLVKSSFGILEPTTAIQVEKENIDIYFVPGTLFDVNGNRKGRGKGYFDKFLEDVKEKKPIIGLCYQYQLVEQLTPKKWDIPVDEVITD